jgi:hypothetical protein
VVPAVAGKEPSFYPNDVEALWELAVDRSVGIGGEVAASG